jgi:glycosyltransferase involved in cell wall biosynthesis
MNKQQPKVTIGMPVYNGEPYLAEAIESILNQTFIDYELIISDNGSTDKTQQICQAYARKDNCIRYYRHEQNKGAAWNFNRVFDLATGDYFQWLAADDIIGNDSLAQCVAVLDRDPSVVLAFHKASIIDETGKVLHTYNVKLNTDSPTPYIRFRDLLLGHRCFEIFGLIRTKTLRQTSVMGNYGHADGVLLARLSLLGRFQEASGAHFFARKHPNQSMNVYGVYTNILPDYHKYSAWFDPKNAERIIYPHWTIFAEFWRNVWQTSISLKQQIICTYYIVKWVRRVRRELWLDLIVAKRQHKAIKKSTSRSHPSV